MKILKSNKVDNLELPFQVQISFEKIFDFYKKFIDDKKHPYHQTAKQIIKKLENHPELIKGFSDFSILEKYQEEVDFILSGLFPEILTDNEIKAASIPFSFISFKFSNRFEKILKNAGKNYEFRIKNFEDDGLYLQACVMILAYCYGYFIDLKRSFFFDIPDEKLGITKHYRVAFNGDFAEIIPTKDAPKITEDDYKLLLDSFDNIDVWKEKFPLDSYIFKGFGIMNLFDVTSDETISSLTANLLRSDDNLISDLEKNLRALYNIKDLKIGFSVLQGIHSKSGPTKIKRSVSIILSDMDEFSCKEYFCKGTLNEVIMNKRAITISDVERYGKATNQNPFYRNLKSNKIQSIILIPIQVSGSDELALLEIASPRPYELNSVARNKLKDIIPVFETAVGRASEENHNVLEATIQEHYTAIHPSVKWRFYEAAEKYQEELRIGNKMPNLDEIVFKDVFPLFAQLDVKGSSVARNTAIQKDLSTQLKLAINVLIEACNNEPMPIYDELRFRVNEYLDKVKNGLKEGDEVNILDFLKREIYPVFNHVKNVNDKLASLVDVYKSRLDEELGVVYEKRKDYENSVTLLNERLANYIDKKQEEAQKMFPHYFERYKTDGVEYNMYIGQSLEKNNLFDDVYLFNLRLWQLQTTYEMENLAFQLRNEMEHDLEVASLILVHSNPLAIKFRMDEKQFDVDGAYNIRYEIIKKRIDKAHIKGTNDRLTVPGKIAIVYSQDKEAEEYKKYIKFLQSKNMLGEMENLEIEDLQGVSGLKALRVEVIYKDNINDLSTMTVDDLIGDKMSVN